MRSGIDIDSEWRRDAAATSTTCAIGTFILARSLCALCQRLATSPPSRSWHIIIIVINYIDNNCIVDINDECKYVDAVRCVDAGTRTVATSKYGVVSRCWLVASFAATSRTALHRKRCRFRFVYLLNSFLLLVLIFLYILLS